MGQRNKKRISLSIVILLLIAAQAHALFYAFWDGSAASIPAGWHGVSTGRICEDGDDNCDFYEKFSMCTAGTPYLAGGSKTTTFTTSLKSSAPSSSVGATQGVANGFNGANANHIHSTATLSGGSLTNTTMPRYRSLLVIRTMGYFPATIPSGVIIFFNSTTIPSGFTRYSEEDDLFPLGNMTVATGGRDNHTLGQLNFTISGNDAATVQTGIKAAVANLGHSHQFNNSMTSQEQNIPAFYTMVMIKANSDQAIPNGTIGMFNQSISNSNWTQIQDCNGYYIKANNSFNVTVNHSSVGHGNLTGTTSGASAFTNRLFGSTNFADSSHTHSVNVSINNQTITPPYRTMLFYTFQLRPPPPTFSFTLFTLSNPIGNFTTSKTTFPGNETDSYIFNTTKRWDEYVPACIYGSGIYYSGTTRKIAGTCQNGTNIAPLFTFRNTGNINLNYSMNLSVDLSGSGIRVCANASKPTGSTATVSSGCSFAGKGNLNNSANILLGFNIPSSAPNYEINISLWANYTAVGIGGFATAYAYSNSTSYT